MPVNAQASKNGRALFGTPPFKKKMSFFSKNSVFAKAQASLANRWYKGIYI